MDYRIVIDRIKHGTLTGKEVRNFLTGNFNYFLYWVGLGIFVKDLPHYLYRLKNTDEDCLENKGCDGCGCTLPAALFCNWECSGKCGEKINRNE